MKVFQAERHFQTTGGLHVTDITDDVAEIVRESGVVGRHLLRLLAAHDVLRPRQRVRARHVRGLRRRCSAGSIPHETYYAHDDWDRRTENICEEDMEQPNGHAHCMSMILGSAGESIPVGDGELCLGTVAARALHRARPLAPAPLALQGRRLD